MCALEQNFLSNCPNDFKPLLYRRFVDDAFCIFHNIQQVEGILQYLNFQHPNIRFTHENVSLMFFDACYSL